MSKGMKKKDNWLVKEDKCIKGRKKLVYFPKWNKKSGIKKTNIKTNEQTNKAIIIFLKAQYCVENQPIGIGKKIHGGFFLKTSSYSYQNESSLRYLTHRTIPPQP